MQCYIIELIVFSNTSFASEFNRVKDIGSFLVLMQFILSTICYLCP